LQAEILWFEPDAYATGPAFQQAVGHTQSLRAAGSTDVALQLSKAREALAKLESAEQRDESAIKQAQMDVSFLERRMEAGRFDAADDVAGIFDAEAARNLTPDQILQRAASSASANLGKMMEHIDAAGGDLAAEFKAAAKYGGRVLQELLKTGKTDLSPEAKALMRFAQSRWPILEGDVPKAFIDLMVAAYGESIGMSVDELAAPEGRKKAQQAFVAGMRGWAISSTAELHAVSATLGSVEQG
jgi:hypothetical protein